MFATRTARLLAFAALIAAPTLAIRAQVPSASDPTKYVLPPQPIVDVFDAEPLPQTLLSPNHQMLALTKARAYPTIAELSQPMLRLAGARVNPKTNGPHRASGLPGTGIYAITLEEDRRRRARERDDAAAAARLEREVLARRLAAGVSEHEGRRHRAVDRRRRPAAARKRVTGSRSHQRDDRRSVRLAAGQRDDRLRARPFRPRRGAGASRPCRRARTSGELRQGGAGRRPTKTCSRRRTTRRCSSTTSRASSPRSTPRPARRRPSDGRRSSTT